MSSTDSTGSPVVLAKLDGIYQLMQFKARYFRFLDTKQWDEWAQCFAPQAVMDMSGEPAAMAAAGFEVPEGADLIWRGRDNIRAAVSSAMAHASSCHHGHMNEIELTSPTSAQGIWAMEDVVCYPGPKGFRGYGHYHDTYVNIDGCWFIETTRLARLLVLPFGQS